LRVLSSERATPLARSPAPPLSRPSLASLGIAADNRDLHPHPFCGCVLNASGNNACPPAVPLRRGPPARTDVCLCQSASVGSPLAGGSVAASVAGTRPQGMRSEPRLTERGDSLRTDWRCAGVTIWSSYPCRRSLRARGSLRKDEMDRF
jgi:hypothetical protein